MKLRSRNGHITSLPDTPPPPKKKRRGALVLYLLLLALVFVYIFFYFMDRTVHYAVRGRVERELFPVETDVEGRLTRFLVAVGERVESGQPVAVVRSRQPSSGTLTTAARAKLNLQLQAIESEARHVTRQLTDMQAVAHRPEEKSALVRLDPKVGGPLIKNRRDMALQRADLARIQMEKAALDSRLTDLDARQRQQRALELKLQEDSEPRALISRQNELARRADSARAQIEALSLHRDARIHSEIESLRTRGTLLEREIQTLKDRLAAVPESATSGFSGASVTVRAPLGGQVALLYTENGRFCRKGEGLLALARDEGKMRIDGYFPLDAQPRLTPGTEVEIIFPDGYESKGTIARTYSTALPEPVKVTHKYVPVEVALTVEIQPINETDARRWAEYDQMDVRLKVTRWR